MRLTNQPERRCSVVYTLQRAWPGLFRRCSVVYTLQHAGRRPPIGLPWKKSPAARDEGPWCHPYSLQSASVERMRPEASRSV